MKFERVIFRLHALQRMFERGVNTQTIVQVLKAGEPIENYAADTPYPSQLLLGWDQGNPLHVVAAITEDGTAVVITVYRPDPARWDDDFRQRRE